MTISLPPEIKDHWIEITVAVLGIFLGWVIARISTGGKLTASRERAHTEERRATELEARLAHAVSDARHNAQQAQTFAHQLAEARSAAANSSVAETDAATAEILHRLEQRVVSMEHAAQFHRDDLQSRLSSIEQFLREAKPTAPPPASAFPGTIAVDGRMKEAFSTAAMADDDFAFVPDTRAAAGDLRAALE